MTLHKIGANRDETYCRDCNWTNATTDQPHPRTKPRMSWLTRVLHQCQFCHNDTRTPECCGVRYLTDRTEDDR